MSITPTILNIFCFAFIVKKYYGLMIINYDVFKLFKYEFIFLRELNLRPFFHSLSSLLNHVPIFTFFS